MSRYKIGLLSAVRFAVLVSILVSVLGTACQAQTNLGNLLGKLINPHGSQQNYTPQNATQASNDKLNAGLALFNKRRYNDAEADFQSAIQYNPSNAMAFNDLGACFMNTNNDSGALVYLMQAERLDSTNKLAKSNLNLLANNEVDQGYSLMSRGGYYQSINDFRTATAANPSDGTAYNDIGCALMDLKEYSVAIPYLKQAIHVGFTSWMPYRNLGICYDQTSAADAVPYYTKDLQLNPKDSTVWGWRGYDYMVNDEYTSAIYDYDKSLAIKPSADVYHWKGDAELDLGKDSAGYADLREARSMNPNLGPIIQADIKDILAARKQQNRTANARRVYLAEARHIQAVVSEGPRYYQIAYAEAKQEGDSTEDADQKSEEARQQYDKDVALQSAWENGDYDTLNKIEAGEMSHEEISAYDPSNRETNQEDNNSETTYDEPSEDSGSMPEESAPVEDAPVDSGGGDE
jgi:tetratricopeptide (TPR) repeat protein